MSLRYSPAQAQSLGLIPAPAIRHSRKTHTADGHAIDPAFTEYTEREFQAEVMDLARRGGWTCGAKDVDELQGLTYHSVSVMAQSERGWPDLTLFRRRDRRLIFAEVKRENGELSPRQAAVLDLLRCLSNAPPLWGQHTGPFGPLLPGNGHGAQSGPIVQVAVWRPSDLEAIREVLR